MNAKTRTARDSLSIEKLKCIDAIADEFERAIQAGTNPIIRDFVDRVEPSLCEALEEELAVIQLQYGRESEDGQRQLNTVDQSNSGSTEPSATPVSKAAVIAFDAESHEPTDMFASGTLFGQYRIESFLGKGGMGCVYKARHTRLGKTVALKVLPLQLSADRERIARFKREMRSLGRFDHPHVVRALDAGEINGVYYLAMEFVDGKDLRELVLAHGPCSVADACRYMADAAKGLQAAHDAGIVHRDIKPANFLLAPGGIVKLADLGLARLLQSAGGSLNQEESESSAAHQVLGTADYMAPEQWEQSSSVDARADLYALGCTLHFLISGKAPFGDDEHSTTGQKMRAHIAKAPPELKAPSGEQIPDALQQLYQRLLAKDPTDRVQNARAVADFLERIIAGAANLDVSETVAFDRPTAIATSTANMRYYGKAWLARAVADLRQIGLRANTRSYRKAWLAGSIACGLLILAINSIAFRSGQPTSQPHSIGSESPDVQPAVIAQSPEIEVELYENQLNGSVLRLGRLGKELDSAKQGQLARLKVSLPNPRYCYLVALNPTNRETASVQLCYPFEGASPQQHLTFEHPGVKTDYFGLTDGRGQQVFLVISSTQPLPTFSEYQASIGDRLSWKSIDAGGLWRFDDGELKQLFKDRNRGGIETVRPIQLHATLQSVFEYAKRDRIHVTAIAFPVQ